MGLEWLFIIGLVVWVTLQHQSLTQMRRQLDKVLAELERLKGPREPEGEARPVRWAASEPSAPKVEPSVAPTYRAPAPPPPASTSKPDEPERPLPEPPPAPLVRPVAPPKPLITRETASTWLAENGLAWIGGGGLALGGLLLVAYAAQKGIFTPPLRIAAAVVLGALMMGASEWILRRKVEMGGRHVLAAAIAAGAGAVTLYGAVCAAHGLYHLIPFWLAGVLAAAVSLGLLALSLRHGEPLALVAMTGAAITPMLTDLGSWSPVVYESYAVLIGATGFVLAATRRWSWTGLATAIGLLLLSAPPLADRQYAASAVLVALAAAGPLVALWRRRGEDPARLAPARRAAGIALVLASLVSFAPWLAPPSQATVAAGLLGAALIGLAAFAAGARLVGPRLYAAPVAVTLLAALACLLLESKDVGSAARPPWLHLLLALPPLAALPAALRLEARGRTTLLAIGGFGAALGATLAWPLLDSGAFKHGWSPAAALSVLMLGLAALIARRVETPARDLGLALWLAAAAEMGFLAIFGAVPTRLEPAAFALTALALSAAARRLSWRGLAEAGVVGGLLALAALLQPEIIGPALEHRLSLPILAAIVLGAILPVFAAAWVLKGAGRRNEAEAQGATALMILLLGLFLGVQILLTDGQGEDPRAPLLAASLRTVILLAAGFVLVLRRRDDDGPLARWRTVLVVGGGLVHGLILQGLVFNPWWGMGEAPAGPPVLNTLLLSYLAPAALLALAAWRRPIDDANRAWVGRAWVCGAAVMGLLWAMLTLRHGVHGQAMDRAPVGRSEIAGYAVLALATARGFFDRRLAARPSAGWLVSAAPVIGWIALALAVLVFGLTANPWWGPLQAPLRPVAAAPLLALAHGAGAALLLELSRRDGAFGKTARAAAIGVLFVLVSLVVRYGFHGMEMGAWSPTGGLETWTFSAVWAAFGLLVLSLGSARKDGVLRWVGLAVLLLTAGKVLLVDLARLEGVVRAASFLAVGALLLGGAVLVRRLNARGAPRNTAPTPDPAPEGDDR